MMHTISLSVTADTGGKSSKLAISGVSAQSASMTANVSAGSVLITPDTNCFFRWGASPVAVADGTDMILMANNTYRVQFGGTGKFAFITSGGTGNVYLTQES